MSEHDVGRTESATADGLELPVRSWAIDSARVLTMLAVSRADGLDRRAVEQRRQRFGLNSLRRAPGPSILKILGDQFRGALVALLAAAGAAAFVVGEWQEGSAILVVLAINAAIGFVTEFKAVRSMEALRKLVRVKSKVRRAGTLEEISAEALVPGDIVVVEAGDVLTADVRLLASSRLQANESTLTGESLPVSKDEVEIAAAAPLMERTDMLLAGTSITRGAGEGVVVATGMSTELGQIASLLSEVEEEVTPLQRRLETLGRNLLWVALVAAGLVGVTGVTAGRDLFLSIETAIALAVAAVPEGLPIITTIALARGVQRMAAHNALLRRLSAVETLGATTIILTDKTGTLTENQMTVRRLVSSGGTFELTGEGLDPNGEVRLEAAKVNATDQPLLRRALEVGVLCNNAGLGPRAEAIGDPIEVALLVAGLKAGLSPADLHDRYPRASEEAFDADLRMMATSHPAGDGYLVAVKGAAEAILPACTHVALAAGDVPLGSTARDSWLHRNETLGTAGYRVLALATKTADRLDASPYSDLTLLGLVCLLDPPRPDVGEALAACRSAGVRVVMVTGDQAHTAEAIARAVGLAGPGDVHAVTGVQVSTDPASDATLRRASILARVSPADKLRLVALHQADGAIVGMTGDGVNDAPALRKADIGIAMGLRGTEVAREAADMVLRDDSFATIVVAIRQGRIIFQNIRSFVVYLLSCNLSEILVVGLASAAHAPLPLLPLQILYLNLVTDVFPALALGMGEGAADTMTRPPRDPREPVIGRAAWLSIAGAAALITGATLSAFAVALLGLNLEGGRALTVSFLTLSLSQLWHVFNMRGRGTGLWSNAITRNRHVWAALVLCVGLLVLAVYGSSLATVLHLENPGQEGWLLAVAASLVPLAVGQVVQSLPAARPRPARL